MSEKSSVQSASSFAPLLLTLLFTGLKLGEVGKVATWSWFWVISPLWITTMLGLTFTLLLVAIDLLERR